MNLSYNEKKLLIELIMLDTGDMTGAHWPIGKLQCELCFELDEIKQLVQELEKKELVTLQGATPCICITPNGKKVLEAGA